MRPAARSSPARRAGALGLAALALLVACLGVPSALGQPDDPVFMVETRYVVPQTGLEAATVFVRYAQDPDTMRPLPRGTLELRAPVGGAMTAQNDTGAALEWVPAEGGGIVVAVPNGTRAIHITTRDVPLENGDGIRFAGPVASARVTLVVALPAGATSDAASVPAGPGTRADLPESWPQPERRTYVAASWAGVDAPDTIRVDAAEAAGPAPLPRALAVGLVVFLVAATVWALVLVHRSVTAPTAARTMPVLDHLAELRNRLLWILGTLLVGAAFFFTFGFQTVAIAGRPVPVPMPTIYHNAAAQVFAWLSARVVTPGVEVIVTNPFDAIVTQFRLAIGLAILVTFPVLFYHAYAFLAPALKPVERRAVLLAVPGVVVLFVLGAAFGLLFMLPFTMRVLYSFAGTLGATTFLNVQQFVGIAAAMAVVFGLAFQLPLVMALTARIGLVAADTYRAKWRHAVLVIAIVAALVTDPTIVTQGIVAVVLAVLYGVGLGLAYLVERRSTEPAEAEAADA